MQMSRKGRIEIINNLSNMAKIYLFFKIFSNNREHFAMSARCWDFFTITPIKALKVFSFPSLYFFTSFGLSSTASIHSFFNSCSSVIWYRSLSFTIYKKIYLIIWKKSEWILTSDGRFLLPRMISSSNNLLTILFIFFSSIICTISPK